MKIAIIGAGPAGVMAGISIKLFDEYNICDLTFFDPKPPLTTLLPTGGGRCNLGYAEFDNLELTKFYPRGEKFLLSVFSRFSTGDTLEFFNNIGVQTYIQEDLRIFPTSDSSKDVRSKLLKKLGSVHRFSSEKICAVEKVGEKFKIITEKSKDLEYELYDKVVFACGIKNNYELLKALEIPVIKPKPALCALKIKQKELYSLSGVSLKNIYATSSEKIFDELFGDLLFTHNSISGPLAYKISSKCAFCDFPYKIKLNLVNDSKQNMNEKLIELFDENSKKDLLNIISELLPRSFAKYLLEKIGADIHIKANQVGKQLRNNLVEALCDFELDIVGQIADGEIVTAGGVDLDYVNAATMEHKTISGLYFCGEVLNIDGFTGGFNLQNCWSTGYIAGRAIASNKKL